MMTQQLEIAAMLRKFINLLFAPLILIGWLIQWLHGASTPAPVRQATARRADAQAVKALLDKAEADDDYKSMPIPTLKNPSPVMLPPAAALAQAGHIIFGTPSPDLSAVLPEVADWIRGMSRDEACAIRRMGVDQLADHVYARRQYPLLRPVDYRDPRRMDEIDEPGYLDEMIADMAHLRA